MKREKHSADYVLRFSLVFINLVEEFCIEVSKLSIT